MSKNKQTQKQSREQSEPDSSIDYMRLSCDNLHIDMNYQRAEWLAADWQGKHILGDIVLRAAYAAFVAGKEQADSNCQYELGVRLSDDAELCRLNGKWRGQNKPTNVLAFATNESPAQTDALCMLGDIVLARETLIREAKAQGKTRFAHLQHLIVHGVLHLLGYDHVSPQQAQVMEKLEREILSDLARLDAKKPLFNKEIAQETVSPYADGEKRHAPI